MGLFSEHVLIGLGRCMCVSSIVPTLLVEASVFGHVLLLLCMMLIWELFG